MLLWLFSSLLAFQSCKEDIDLAKVDPQMQLDLGLALPFGTLETNLNDFLGRSGYGEELLTYDPVDSMLILHMDTMIIEDFHPINLQDYKTVRENSINIVDNMGDDIIDKTLFDYFDELPLPPMQVAINFPCEFQVGNFNFNPEYERIDSMHVKSSHFQISFDVEQFGLSWQEMDSVILLFDDPSLRMDDGNNYRPLSLQGKDFAENMDVTLSDFFLIPYENPQTGINDLTRFNIRMVLTINEGRTIRRNSAFKTSFILDFLDFDVMYGWFEPKKAPFESQLDTLANFFPLDFLKGIKLPFAEPSIRIAGETNTVGIPTNLYIDSIYILDKQGNKGMLTYEGSTTHCFAMPYIATPYDLTTVKSAEIVLDETEENGNFDELFRTMPDYFGYSYRLKIDGEKFDGVTDRRGAPFMMNHADLKMNIKVDLPMKFHAGLAVTYSDTIETFIADMLQFDALLEGISLLDTLKAGDLSLRFVAENNMPFDIKGVIRLLDENLDVVEIGGLYEGGKNDSVIFTGTQDGVIVKEAFTIDLNVDEARQLEKVTYLVYDLFVGDNTDDAAFYANSGIKLNLGLAGKVEAIINLGKENKQ